MKYKTFGGENMKLKNLQNEIEAKSHESSKIIVTRRRKASKSRGMQNKDFLDMVIINVSIAIGVFLLVACVNMVSAGYFAEIPNMLGLS